jgi:hypothetical protein
VRRAALVVAALALAGAAGACSDDGGGDGEGGASTTGAADGAAGSTLPESSPGRGAISLGGVVIELTVTACAPAPGATTGTGATEPIFDLTAEGEARDGVPATVRVQRYETEAEVKTFSDTVTYQDTARVYQAQRTDSGGTVIDLRDPDATTALLQIDGARVVARGVAGPPGDDETRIDLLLDATCPAT